MRCQLTAKLCLELDKKKDRFARISVLIIEFLVVDLKKYCFAWFTISQLLLKTINILDIATSSIIIYRLLNEKNKLCDVLIYIVGKNFHLASFVTNLLIIILVVKIKVWF